MTKDEIIRKRFPTLMAPRDGSLPECPVGETRLLMAADGLYLETNQPWGRLVRCLWSLSRHRPLPYGTVEGFDGFSSVLQHGILPIISVCMIKEAAEYAREGNEWAGLVVWDGEGYYYHPVSFKASCVRAEDILMPWLPEGHFIAGDVHSHHRMSPSFSSVDDRSDGMGARVSVVLGNFSDTEDGPRFDWRARYCVQGFIFSDDSDRCPEVTEYDPERIDIAI